ncbi:hypothetical protein [Methylorubrum extorquens]
MTAEPVIRELRDLISALTTSRRLDVFIFGSALVSTSAWSDIDVLLVYDCIDDAASAKSAMADICERFPIDLTVTSVEEEAELDFVKLQKCRWLASTELI